MEAEMLRLILLSLSSLLFANSVWATEIITSDVGSWSSTYGFQSCYGYQGSRPCVSDGTYFANEGIGSGDVVFAYQPYNIYNTFTIPAGFSGSTMYLSLDLMTGPRNSEQGNKTEYVIITVQQKNSSGTVIQTDTINENITNTTMTTYDYTIAKHADVTQVYIQISGKDGGYWAGNYGAVIGAGTITLNDGSTSSSSSSPTPSYSSSITAAQSSRRSSVQSSATGAEINANIDGDSNEVYIHQTGTHYVELGIIGNSNTANIEQTSTQIGIMHYAEIDILGNSNTLDLVQSGDGNKTAFIGINGDNNIADIIQKDGGQHYLQLDLVGDSHDATVVQEGSGNHAATVELTNGGGAWTFNLNQAGSTSKEYSLPHSISDGSTTSGTCYVAAGCSLTVIQND